MMNVYLSGGMRSNWQDKVRASCPLSQGVYIDPRKHGLDDPSSYAAWDLAGVKKSDIVFAYMEANNPSGVGLSLEVGYAKALGKLIIFADEKNDRRMAIVRAIADIVVEGLPAGIKVLASFIELFENVKTTG